MAARLHLISGLPRSGSTLLAGLLRQNPGFHAAVQSPLADVFRTTLQAMSSAESACFIDDQQRERALRGLLQAYYSHMPNKAVIFDTHRAWCGLLTAIARVSPESRVICCLRSPAWILDSIERLVRSNALRASKIFNHETGNVFARTELLTTKQLLSPALHALRQAWFSEQADRLIAIQYDSLVEQPHKVMDSLYDLLGEPHFAHDFDRVEYDEAEFDEKLGLPGMHKVSGPVAPRRRDTILPPEIFSKHEGEFWVRGSNPRKVVVL